MISMRPSSVSQRGWQPTHNSRSVHLDVSEQLRVASTLDDELPDGLVAELDLLFADRRRCVGREADEVEVLQRVEGVRTREDLRVPLNDPGKVERRGLVIGQGRDRRGD